MVGGALVLGCAGSTSPAPAPGHAIARQTADQARAAEVETLLSSGRVFAQQQRLPEAEMQLRGAIKLTWGFAEPWPRYRAEALTSLAHCLVKEQRPADAREAVAQALALTAPGALAQDRRIFELQITQAEAFRAEHDSVAAIGSFSAAVDAAARHQSELAPGFVQASLKLAETLEALGRHQAATKALERALAVAKQSRDALPLAGNIAQALAAIYEESGEPRRAQALRGEYATETQDPGAASPGTAASAAPSPDAATANRGDQRAALQVASMQADFRACYQASLADDYDLAGRVELVIRVAADGRVAGVKANGPSLPPTAVECLLRRAALARFDPPAGGHGTITVPVTFVNQD
jgi:tetratricopeptide (TPR) repeat protein